MDSNFMLLKQSIIPFLNKDIEHTAMAVIVKIDKLLFNIS